MTSTVNANFSDVASRVNAPQGMSIADMLNVARGAQAYQQAQQTNPLALRQQQAETEFAEQQKPKLLRQSDLAIQLAEGTNPSKIAQAKAESESSQLKLGGEKLRRVLDISSARASDREVLGLSQLAMSQDPKVAKAARDRLHELNANDFQTAVQSGLTPNEALQSFGHITNIIDKAPSQLPNLYQNATRIGTGASGLLGQQAPAVATSATGQISQVNPLAGTVQTLSGNNPSSMFELNGVKYMLNAQGQPVQVGSTGTTTTNEVQPKGVTPQAMGEPKARFEPLVKDLMSIPTGGVTQLNKQQQDAYNSGIAHHNSVIDKANLAEDAKQTTNLIRQNIAATAGSKPEQVLRSAGKWIAGDEQLDKLVKNLAQNAQLQASIMGVDSVHGQQVNQLANGSENITAGALKSIADRTDATSTAFEKYAKAYGTFINKKGDVNGHANTLAFKEAWKDNYDPRIFMIQNINSSNLAPKVKQKEVSEILNSISPSEFEKFKTKMFNMKRLEKGDF